MIFTPSKVTDQQLMKIWSFLTKQMCMTQKSRIYCQLSIIEEMLRHGEKPATLDDWESALVAKIAHSCAGYRKGEMGGEK